MNKKLLILLGIILLIWVPVTYQYTCIMGWTKSTTNNGYYDKPAGKKERECATRNCRYGYKASKGVTYRGFLKGDCDVCSEA